MYINGYNRQKVMEVIKTHNTGSQAVDTYGDCQYRAYTNDIENMCLVGCFIPENKYSEDMESRDATDVITSFDLFDDMPLPVDVMNKLQCFHDEELDEVHGKLFFDAIEKKLIDLEQELG